MSKHIPIEEQANVPGGLASFDLGTVPGQPPPNFGRHKYSRLPPLDGLVIRWQRLTPAECLALWKQRDDQPASNPDRLRDHRAE